MALILSKEWYLRCQTCLDMGPRFCGFNHGTASFIHLVKTAQSFCVSLHICKIAVWHKLPKAHDAVNTIKNGSTFLCVVGPFGVITYGCHINGYTYKNGEMMMWVAKRSPTKQTYPNLLDQFVSRPSLILCSRICAPYL